MATNYDSIAKNDIRARELLQAFFNQYDANPEIHIWPDESRAYIASDADQMYPLVARIIQQHGTQVCDIDDRGDINNAIYGEYEHFCEVAAEQIKSETQESEDVNDGTQQESWLHTWEGPDGFYFCYSGVNRDGLYSESEDVGPFESRERTWRANDARPEQSRERCTARRRSLPRLHRNARANGEKRRAGRQPDRADPGGYLR
jgi:hypothetical protein